MTEHTDKPPQKPGMTTPRKRPGKRPAPDGRRASASQERGAADAKVPGGSASGAAPRSPLAPDPATVVFGSNRPIAAPPARLPEGSGLRFAGPSAGILKASGPQPASPKANGLTFTSAKAPPAKATPARPAKPAKAKRVESKKAEAVKPEAEKPALTKPVIAPQASGPRFEKERSASGFVAVMLALTVLGGGLAFWMKLSHEPASPQETVEQAAIERVAPEMTTPSPGEPEASFEPPVAEAVAPEAPARPAQAALLTDVEIAEIQDLLSRLDFDPGTEHGVLTAATTAAIRSYQEMAGLPADGEANRALLEELRSVAELYGS